MSKLKIVFMGTPEFAEQTLKGILLSGETVSLVITQPDRPSGRGLKLVPSPVKLLANKNGIEVLTPEKIRSKELESKLLHITPDLIIVSAYGKIIPKSILDIPKLYPINVHASLLPKYRGAAPINWAIINGEEKTGITIMKMNEEMDAGEIMLQKDLTITPEDDASTLHDKLAALGSELIVEAISVIKNGLARFKPQDESLITLAPILDKKDGLICWDKSSREIFNFIRGMYPWPGAYTYLSGKLIKIYRSTLPLPGSALNLEDIKPGVIIGIREQSIAVRTQDGVVLLGELQQESKKRLPAMDFCRGFTKVDGLRFEGSKG